MTDTAKRLAGPSLLTASAATYYTVPALTTAIVRSIQVANETGSIATVTLSIGTDGAGKRLFKEVSVPGNGVINEQTFLVLTAAEIIQAFSGTASALTLTISGVEIT